MNGHGASPWHVFPQWPVDDSEHETIDASEHWSTDYPVDECWYCADGTCVQRVKRRTISSDAVVVHGTLRH